MFFMASHPHASGGPPEPRDLRGCGRGPDQRLHRQQAPLAARRQPPAEETPDAVLRAPTVDDDDRGGRARADTAHRLAQGASNASVNRDLIILKRMSTHAYGYAKRGAGQIDISTSHDPAFRDQVVEPHPIHDHHVCGHASTELGANRIGVASLRRARRCRDREARRSFKVLENRPTTLPKNHPIG